MVFVVRFDALLVAHLERFWQSRSPIVRLLSTNKLPWRPAQKKPALDAEATLPAFTPPDACWQPSWGVSLFDP